MIACKVQLNSRSVLLHSSVPPWHDADARCFLNVSKCLLALCHQAMRASNKTIGNCGVLKGLTKRFDNAARSAFYPLNHIKTGTTARQQSGAPAGVEQRHAERAQAAELRVALLAVAHSAHELLHRDGLLVLEAVLLRRQPAAVDQYVGVRCAAPHTQWTVRLLSLVLARASYIQPLKCIQQGKGTSTCTGRLPAS